MHSPPPTGGLPGHGSPGHGWPGHQPPGYGLPGHLPSPYGYGGYAPPPQPHGGLATASLVLGIIGIVLGVIPFLNFAAFPVVVLAIIFGIVAWRWGKAKAGVILGSLGLAVAVVWTVLIVVVINNGVDQHRQFIDCRNRGGSFDYCSNRYGSI